jgi:hypothetical protein
MKKVLSLVQAFWEDMLDRGAAQRQVSDSAKDFLAIVTTAVAASCSFITAVEKLGALALGNLSPLLPLLMVISGTTVTFYIVCAKMDQHLLEFQAIEKKRQTYVYTQFVRQLSKLGILAFLLFLPSKVLAAADSIIPMPTRISGYIFDAATGEPLPDVEVGVLTSEGRDITSGTFLTDSDGYFIIVATQPIRRSDSLKMKGLQCLGIKTMQLTRDYQSGRDAAGPTFRFNVDCKKGTKR